MRTRAGVLVGRETELAAALGWVSDSMQGSGPACFCVGEPGAGKSRLLAEVAERACVDGLVVVRGRASGLGPVSPLRPFAEALASIQRQGLLPDDHLGGYRALLGRVLPQLAGPASAASAETPPIVAFAEAVLRVLTVIGSPAGCLLVLEDLHDADPESLAVLEYLLDNIAATPVAVLGALRDEPGGAREMLAAGELRGTAQLLPIPSLDQPATSALIAACLGCDRPSPQLAELIWRSSAGNPLMVEEMLHELIDNGRLDHEGESLRLPADVLLAPPPSMLQLVGARLSRLTPAARAVLIAGAVYGEHFPVATVETALAEIGVWDAIDVGLAQQLIAATAPGWYRFYHPLTHATILELAGQAERRQAAARLAEAVLAEDPDQVAATCRLAARLLADAGKPTPAGRLYARSGQEALRDGAVEWAVADLSEAFRLAPSQPDWIGELVEALIYGGQLDRALELAARLDPPVDGPSRATRARLHLNLVRGCRSVARMEQAAVHLARARELAAGVDDELLRIHCDAMAAIMLSFNLAGAANPAAEQLACTTAEAAEQFARTATGASAQEAAQVACRAWHALICFLEPPHREREREERLKRIEALAGRYQLHHWLFIVRAGKAHDQWMADGDPMPMQLVRDDAQRLGEVRLAAYLDTRLLLNEVLVGKGSLAAVTAALSQCTEEAQRVGDPVRRDMAVGTMLLAAGLRADRPALTELLIRCQPTTTDVSPALDEEGHLSAAQAICLALEGRDGEALATLEGVERRPQAESQRDSYTVGPLTLLATLAGTASLEQVTEALHSFSRTRWNRQFLHWAAAVQAGRRGETELAASHAERAAQAAEIYPVPRHLAARLTALAAAADGWGSPVEDLRAAEAWFHQNGIPAAARSCRDVLRTLGAPIQYRRGGTDTVPLRLRAIGVTAREYEICLLVREHLDNRTIGERLHISHRTVEKHIATLLAKLTVPNRRALIDRITEPNSMQPH